MNNSFQFKRWVSFAVFDGKMGEKQACMSYVGLCPNTPITYVPPRDTDMTPADISTWNQQRLHEQWAKFGGQVTRVGNWFELTPSEPWNRNCWLVRVDHFPAQSATITTKVKAEAVKQLAHLLSVSECPRPAATKSATTITAAPDQLNKKGLVTNSILFCWLLPCADTN